MKLTKLLKTNVSVYNNVDIISGVPKGLAHIEYHPLLKTLKIPYFKALIGFRQRTYPILSGVVIDERHKNKLVLSIEQKNETKKQKEIKQIEKIKKEMTIGLLAQALYVVNKHAKEDRSLYSYKERVLSRFAPMEVHINTFVGERRNYIIRRHYDDDYEYEDAVATAQRDEQDRPYISNGIENITNLFHYYEIEGFGFHSPIAENNLHLPERTISENEQFVSPRGIDLNRLEKRISLDRAVKIIRLYCSTN